MILMSKKERQDLGLASGNNKLFNDINGREDSFENKKKLFAKTTTNKE